MLDSKQRKDTHPETLNGRGKEQQRVETEDRQGKKEGGFLWKGFRSVWLVVFSVCDFPFETVSHYVALDGQELTI